ncbi:MAG: FHA domain-containing protein [Anaerolineae bacterium]|nr:FHA domain-containing protein [Anaerolineae bacterium]
MKNLQTEQALLIWREGDIIKDQWILHDTEAVISIGRSPDCAVSIPVRWISRTHAVLHRRGGQFVLEDAGSKNGVFINGQRVVKPHPLSDGDVIQLAPGLELLYVDSEATAPLPGQKGLGLHVDPTERQVYVHGQLVSPPLSNQQYQLLALLVEKPGKVYSRAEVVEASWPDEDPAGVTDDAIDALVRRLRQRLAEIDPEHNFIVTVRGYGFRLDNSIV